MGLALWQGFLFCKRKITLNGLCWFIGEFMSFLRTCVVVQLEETEHNRINIRKTLSLGLFYCFFFLFLQPPHLGSPSVGLALLYRNRGGPQYFWALTGYL